MVANRTYTVCVCRSLVELYQVVVGILYRKFVFKYLKDFPCYVQKSETPFKLHV